MTTVIISIILNLLIGTPTEEQNTVDTNTTTTTTTTTTSGTFTTMGGTGTWTNTDK